MATSGFGWLLFGAAVAGFSLGDAKAWVIERWGGRLSAYLLLKARNLRREHIAFRDEPISILSQLFDRPPRAVVGRNGAANDEQGGKPSEGEAGSVHNVIPLRHKS